MKDPSKLRDISENMQGKGYIMAKLEVTQQHKWFYIDIDVFKGTSTYKSLLFGFFQWNIWWYISLCQGVDLF